MHTFEILEHGITGLGNRSLRPFAIGVEHFRNVTSRAY